MVWRFPLPSPVIWNIHFWKTSTWNLCMLLKALIVTQLRTEYEMKIVHLTMNFLCNEVNVTMKSQTSEQQQDPSVLLEMLSSCQAKGVHPSPRQPDCS